MVRITKGQREAVIPITHMNIAIPNFLRHLAEYFKAISLRTLGSCSLITSPGVLASGMSFTHLQPWSRLSDKHCMSSSSKKIPQQSRLFTELLRAVQSDNPAEALAALLKEHEGHPYYSDLKAKAKTLLYVRSHGQK